MEHKFKGKCEIKNTNQEKTLFDEDIKVKGDPQFARIVIALNNAITDPGLAS